MNPLSRLKKAVESWAIPTEEPLKTGKAVVSSIEVDSGKRPIFTFRELSEAYEGCDIVQTAVQQLASEIVGMGFKTEMNESYNIKLNGKTAKDVIDDWNQKNNLDEFMSIWGIELISMGNSFCIPTNDGLVPIPIKSIWKTIPVDKTTPMFLKYHLELTGSYDNRVIKDFIHFKINQDSNSMPLGRGIIEKLLNTRTHDVPSLLEVDEKIRKAMLFGFERQGWGEQLWDIPELSAEDLSKFDEDIKDIKKGKAKRIVTNAKGATVTSATLDRSRSFDEWLVQIENRLVMALGDPMLKSTIAGNFSEASIRGVTALHKSIIRQYQQVLKRGVEKLWRQVLIDAVFDPDEAQVKLVFNEDTTEVVPTNGPVNKPVPETKPTPELIQKVKESLQEGWITKNGQHIYVVDGLGPVDISNPDNPKVHYDPVKPGPDAPPDPSPKVEPDPYADQHAASVDSFKTDMRIANASYQDSASTPDYWIGKLQGQDPEALKYKMDSIDKSIAANVFHGKEKDIALASREGIKKLLGGS